MKILFFTLGSPVKRLYGKKKYSFDEFLKEDIIFFGPSKDHVFLYNGRSFPIIQLSGITSIFDVLNELPSGWEPEIVTCETIVLSYIPDFYKIPYKTLCFTRDSWGDVLFNPKITELFDVVYYQTVDILNIKKNYVTNLLPIIGSPISIPRNKQKKNFSDRKIDILTIANYNDGFYHDRLKLFSFVSKELGKYYNIKFIKGIKYENIHKYYNNSKIVLDYSYVMSARSYEANLNGCLLFSNENNSLISKVWEANKEFVPYNFKNVISLLKEYLEDHDKSVNIIKNAKEKLAGIPTSPGEVYNMRIKLSLQKDLSIKKRLNRIRNWPISILYYCLSTPLYFNYNYQGHNHPHNWQNLYFERINLALNSNPSNQLKIKELIEATRMAFLLKKEKIFFKYINELEYIIPEYGWIYYLKAKVYFEKSEYYKAKYNLDKAIEYGERYSNLLKEIILPFNEKKNPVDGRRIGNYMWQFVEKEKEEFQIKAFFQNVYELLGDVNLSINNKDVALEYYLKSIEQYPFYSSFYKASEILFERNDFKKVVSIFKIIDDENPYDYLSALYVSFSLLKMKKKYDSLAILHEKYKMFKNFITKNKFFNKNRIITYIFLSLIEINIIFSHKISSLITLKIINYLKKVK